jgi:hypothetical protein
MRNDGYDDGGPEPEKPKGKEYEVAVELLCELDCECEPSESTCARCAALGDLADVERRNRERIATLERERAELIELVSEFLTFQLLDSDAPSDQSVRLRQCVRQAKACLSRLSAAGKERGANG